MRVLWERFDLVLLIFLKSYFKKWIRGRNNWKISRMQRIRRALRRYRNSTALPQSYPASIGSGMSILLEIWIILDGRMLNYGLAGRSQNVLFNLYLLYTKIEYKKSIFFIVTPCLFWDRIWIRLRIWWRLVKEFFKKIKNWRIYRVGKFLPV